MVLAVLVPGITTFGDLMKPIEVPGWWKVGHPQASSVGPEGP
jgi:hypothetical protein